VAHKHRIEVEGGIYHVTARGNARAAIFRDEQDYRVLRDVVSKTVEQHRWRCHSYCLLPNHYHFLVETPEPNLGRGMLVLNGTYARRFNWRYQRYGHVFQGPYGAVLIEDDDHLLEVCRYIALNPVRAGLVRRPGDWPWSSYCALAGLAEAPAFLHVDLAHSLLGGASGYRDFVAAAPTS
jgi:REP element-mobilizing transposase RayT